jgi:N-acetylated-alpha-linked acidic dipeptidase
MDHRALIALSALQLFGFSPDQTPAQKSIEQRFDADLKTDDLDTWMKKMSSEPNQVGAPHNKENAEFVRDQLKSWGWDAQIEEFYPLYPTLKHHTLELVSPTRCDFVAN